jgi:hypothetical protein
MYCVGGKVLIFVWAVEQQANSRRQFQSGQQDVFVSWKKTPVPDRCGETVSSNSTTEPTVTTYQRFYHVFCQGELEQLIHEAAKEGQYEISLTESGYDRDNWYAIVQKIK